MIYTLYAVAVKFQNHQLQLYNGHPNNNNNLTPKALNTMSGQTFKIKAQKVHGYVKIREDHALD